MTPWKSERLKAAVTIGIMLVAVTGSWWYAGRETYIALLAFLILWGSLGPFFVTARFVIDPDGVEVDSPFLKRRRRWSEIRSYYLDDKGVTLSPFSGPSWLEAYRSIRLLFGEHGPEIRKLLHEQLGEPIGARPERH